MSDRSSRREFVKRSAALVAVAIVLLQIIPSSVLGIGGKLPPGNRLVMSIIGTGSQGVSYCYDFMRLNNEIQFVALCDVDANRLTKAKETIDITNKSKACRTYSNYSELLEIEKIDAKMIAIPDHWHGIIYSEVANKKFN